MAWRVPAGSLAPGATVTVAFLWPNNTYQGVQVVHAKPVPRGAGNISLIAPTTFRVSDARLSLELNGGYTYRITVTNEGPWESDWELVGGNV
jgi:hypothetical protein